MKYTIISFEDNLLSLLRGMGCYPRLSLEAVGIDQSTHIPIKTLYKGPNL